VSSSSSSRAQAYPHWTHLLPMVHMMLQGPPTQPLAPMAQDLSGGLPSGTHFATQPLLHRYLQRNEVAKTATDCDNDMLGRAVGPISRWFCSGPVGGDILTE
jgi:hypothetical protein